jgi:hypothetical protein
MKEFLRELLSDFKKLFRASKMATGSLFLVGLYSGVEQLLLAYSLGQFLDALIGARGLRVMTSDVTKWFWLTALFIILTIGVRIFSRSFAGLMLSVRDRLRSIVRFICSSLVGGAVVPLHVVAALCVAGFARTREDSRAKKLAAVISLLLLFAGAYSLFASTVVRDASIGQFIFWTTAIALVGRQLVVYESDR